MADSVAYDAADSESLGAPSSRGPGRPIGREFTYEMLHALVKLEEPVLQDGLSQLVDHELLYQRGRPPRAKYTFKHALVQDAAYQSLLRRTRQQYHQQGARLYANRSSNRCSLTCVPHCVPACCSTRLKPAFSYRCLAALSPLLIVSPLLKNQRNRALYLNSQIWLIFAPNPNSHEMLRRRPKLVKLPALGIVLHARIKGDPDWLARVQ